MAGASVMTGRYPAPRPLRRGCNGADVRRLQVFLNGKGFFNGHVDGEFGSLTEQGVKEFQRAKELVPDGVVGPMTLAALLQSGIDWIPETDETIEWPAAPDLQPLLSNRERERRFGVIEYRSAPEPDNAEAIEITNDWAEKYLVKATLPIISAKFLHGKALALHKDVVVDFTNWLRAVEKEGLANRILTFDGLWCPRFMRGSRQSLSAHAWATALDINCDWNGLGATPAYRGKPGSVRELVELANAHNLYWGGHFKGRRDGMHFEHTGKLANTGSRVQTYSGP